MTLPSMQIKKKKNFKYPDIKPFSYFKRIIFIMMNAVTFEHEPKENIKHSDGISFCLCPSESDETS